MWWLQPKQTMYHKVLLKGDRCTCWRAQRSAFEKAKQLLITRKKRINTTVIDIKSLNPMIFELAKWCVILATAVSLLSRPLVAQNKAGYFCHAKGGEERRFDKLYNLYQYFISSQAHKLSKLIKKNMLTIVVEDVKCFCLFKHTYFWSGSLLLTSLENAGLPFTVDHRVQSEVNLIACIPFRWSLESPPHRSVTPEVCRHRPRTWQAKAVQLLYSFILVSVELADSMSS